MPTHYWGDEDFDWDSLYKAERELNRIMKRYGRIGVHSKEKYGCYDDQTEVLTSNGWKHFKDVDIEKDLFMSIDQNDNLFYQRASHYFEYNYNGKMYSLNTRGVDLLVTTNHSLYLAKAPTNGGVGNTGRKEFPYEFATYEKYYRVPKIFKKGGKWEGKEIQQIKVNDDLIFEADNFLALLGWYVAEGCTSKKSQITFCLNYKNDKEMELVANIISSLGLKPHIFKKRGTINIYNKDLVSYLDKECGKLALNKKAPDFIKNLSPRQITIFLKNLYLGDGHKNKTSHVLTTISKTLSDDVCELLIKANTSFRTSNRMRSDYVSYIKGRQIKPKYRVYEINWLKNSNTHITPNSHDTFEKIENQEKVIDYSGKVYCVEVPNHILLVRRNGKAVFCGNSLRFSIYLCDGTLHSFTHPGYVRSQYPKWLWCFDLDYQPLRFLTPVINFWQKLVLQYAFTVVTVKYPHIRKEIISDAPKELLPCDLAIECAKMWRSSCSHCGEMSTTDHYKCPYCGEVKR